jgi:hypothetical protein
MQKKRWERNRRVVVTEARRVMDQPEREHRSAADGVKLLMNARS